MCVQYALHGAYSHPLNSTILGEVVAKFRQKLFTHHPKHSEYNNRVPEKL
jgi:hypothetical protein